MKGTILIGCLIVQLSVSCTQSQKTNGAIVIDLAQNGAHISPSM